MRKPGPKPPISCFRHAGLGPASIFLRRRGPRIRSGVTMPGMRWAVFRFAFASPIFWLWALTMAKNASFSVRPAAALLLPLTLLAATAFAQTDVKEDSVILQHATVKDDAPIGAVRIGMPRWTHDRDPKTTG